MEYLWVKGTRLTLSSESLDLTVRTDLVVLEDGHLDLLPLVLDLLGGGLGYQREILYVFILFCRLSHLCHSSPWYPSSDKGYNLLLPTQEACFPFLISTLEGYSLT